ncbi:MAG: Germination-specific N-acetylmuramoyl-L-alanine amidase [Firmicutes bacterium]|nr:Germination-specific N-acetylmuramoyl-L-alanine amidase [Bacillota bacterium]
MKRTALSIAQKLRSLLESSGAKVVMTRETDTDLSGTSLGHQYSRRKRQDLSRRVALINASGATLLVSIHLNSMTARRWYGAQVFFASESSESKRLAVTIQESLRETLQNTHRLAAAGDYYILEKTKCPAVIVEAGFISNPAEARLLQSEQYQARVALAIYRGIVRFVTVTDGP